MRQTLTAAQTKAQFAESLRLVEQGDIVVITRHGKPVAAMINVDELDQFERLRAAGPELGLGSLVDRWEDTAATALHHHLVVVTANIRHFERIPGLQLHSFTPSAQS